MLKNNVLALGADTYDISAFGGIRWDGEKRQMFFLDLGGKVVGQPIDATADQYRHVEAMCVPYWRTHGQCIE